MAEVEVQSIDTDVYVIEENVQILTTPDVTSVHLGASGPQGPRGSQVLSGNVDPSPTIGLIGDQYINTTTGKLFGPKTASGWGEGISIASLDPNDLGQVYTQASPSTVWNIAHTLGFTPNVMIVDTQENVVEPALKYINANQIRATFSEAIAGKAYIS